MFAFLAGANWMQSLDTGFDWDSDEIIDVFNGLIKEDKE